VSAQPPEPDPVPLAALEALAAGELDAAHADALRARLAAEPAWQADWARIAEVEALLRAEALIPVPLGVLAGTLARVLPPRRERPTRVLARAAAAVLVFGASWFAFSGDVAAMGALGPRPEVAGPLPAIVAPVDAAWRAAAQEGPISSAPALLASGVALLAAGLGLGVRAHRRAAGAQEEEA
jgi:hypothetical protein